ncbi:TIGR03790 family protein [bacterium]|nr:TIGR03790 family protein [bacterium]
MKNFFFDVFLLVIAPFMLMPTDLSALTADHVLVVYNGSNRDSVKMAQEYRKLRSIPDKNMCYVICPSRETINRDTYNEKIRDPIRKYIAENNLKDKIFCIALIYGMPLKITEGKINKLNNEINKLKRIIKDKKKFIKAENAIKLLNKEIKEKKSTIKSIKKERREASVDSELNMLFEDNYNLAGWLVNPYYFYVHKTLVPFSKKFNIVMVSRIDGPTYESAIQLVHNALEAEKYGLHGNAYIDARGLKSNGAYGDMDKLLVITSKFLRAKGFNTTLENTSKLFGKGKCPNTAIYWGWYALQNYHDSFTFVPGAIGVHIASSECVSLRKPRYWCPEFIKRGITVTMGPVNEPYVQAFPHPIVFFTALLNGFSVAESYYIAQTGVSWQMVLIADPLYTPFRK